MRPNTLKLSLVLALSLATLAACDKHGKKSDEAADTTNTAAAAPATTTTTPTTTAPATTTAAPATVGGEAAGGKRAWKEACADDLKKFCADADKPGKCLREHKSELSQACVSARDAARAAHKADKGDKGE